VATDDSGDEAYTAGSVRGACDETHVPTATPERVHHASRRQALADEVIE